MLKFRLKSIINASNVIRELNKLRGLAGEKGLIPKKITSHIEDYINPNNPLDRMIIKLSPSKNATGSLSQGACEEYKIGSGTYQNPFTGEIGSSVELSHVPIGNPSNIGAAFGGVFGRASEQLGCGCK